MSREDEDCIGEPMLAYQGKSASIWCFGSGANAFLSIDDDEACFAVLGNAQLRRFLKKAVPRVFPRSTIAARARAGRKR